MPNRLSLSGQIAHILVQFFIEVRCLSGMLAIHLPHGECFDIKSPLAC
jgi:hypothetical protein